MSAVSYEDRVKSSVFFERHLYVFPDHGDAHCRLVRVNDEGILDDGTPIEDIGNYACLDEVISLDEAYSRWLDFLRLKWEAK